MFEFNKYHFPIVPNWKNHYIVIGTGGVRTDFLTNWLIYGHHMFHNFGQGWSINLETGHSTSGILSPFNIPGLEKSIDPPYDFKKVLKEMLECHEPNSVKNVASKSHLKVSHIDSLLPAEFHDKTIIASIFTGDLDDSYKRKILWEFLAKTFLIRPRENIKEALVRTGYLSQDEDRDLLEPLKSLLVYRYKTTYRQLYELSHTYSKKSMHVPTKFLDYKKLLDVNGADYVCDQLELPRCDYGRDLWCRAIAASHTPPKVTFLGQDWTLDYIEDLVAISKDD